MYQVWSNFLNPGQIAMLGIVVTFLLTFLALKHPRSPSSLFKIFSVFSLHPTIPSFIFSPAENCAASAL